MFAMKAIVLLKVPEIHDSIRKISDVIPTRSFLEGASVAPDNKGSAVVISIAPARTVFVVWCPI